MAVTQEKEEASQNVVAELRQLFAAEQRLGRGFHPDRLWLEPDGALVLESEVERVAQKKIALEVAAAHPGISAIVDRLRVCPAERLGDAGIRMRLRETYSLDPSLAGLKIVEARGGAQADLITDPDNEQGSLEYVVSDGVVTLNGSVSDLAIKRYIGVLAWWNPGSRDVINGIVAASDESDGPDRIADAVRVVLEKDPYIDAAQLKVGVRGRVVRLTGWLPSAAQARMAENDAWYVFGVDDVINKIETPR